VIFNELTFYLLFLGPCSALFHLVRRFLRPAQAEHARAWLLAGFGCLFFAYYGYVHFGAWGGVAPILIFVWELMTSRLYSPGSRWCIVGILQAVAILFFFKYLQLFLDSLQWTLERSGASWELPVAPVFILPLGISFFTFEFIHFAADSYSGKIQRPQLSTYAAFIFFFPSMVAGPIKRFPSFSSQIGAARFDPDLALRGVTRILTGLAKKHILADFFGLYADRLIRGDATRPVEVALGLLAYGMRIYLDFSAYSDIAIGAGYLFGIHIPENFDWPYLSRNISDFWRRWHISLGSWISDYVYKPLGGSQSGRARTLGNLLIAFALSGIWHGAGYGFLLWGLWHGVMMSIHRLWRWLPIPRPAGSMWALVSGALTFAVVNIGWAFFFLPVDRALAVFRILAGGSTG
jgi:alginate O-acetyltransferase complex protein AlgI